MEHDSVRIPVFSGKPSENPREWLERYENIALFKKWDDAAKLQHVPLFLDETALNWYRILKPDDKKEWKDFKTNFLEVFEQDRYQQRVEIQLLLFVSSKRPMNLLSSFILMSYDYARW